MREADDDVRQEVSTAEFPEKVQFHVEGGVGARLGDLVQVENTI